MNRRIKKLLEILKKLKYDPLTGYISRQYFEYVMKDSLWRMLMKKGGSVVFFDLNNLKHVNDNFGYEIGNNYIKHTTYRIIEEMKEKDNVRTLYPIRYGGDEFLIITKEKIKGDYKLPFLSYSFYNFDTEEINKKYKSLDEIISELGVLTLNKKGKEVSLDYLYKLNGKKKG